MPRKSAVLLLALLAASPAAALMACGGQATQAPASAAPSAGSDAPQGASAAEPAQERLVLLFEELARNVAQVEGDCARTAAALTAWTQAQQPGYAALAEQAAARELPAEQLARYQDRLAAALTVVVDSATGCETHEEARAAFRTFDEMVAGSAP